jgi:MOSC domain-containing protein YiiM
MRVYSLNTSSKKGVQKTPVSEITLVKGKGVKGDAHSGGERQVSLLAREEIDSFNKKMKTKIKPGMFAENITTEGVDFSKIGVGNMIRIGKALLEVTQIGKECHSGCSIKEATGSCIMPKKGVFARVLEGATIRKGDPMLVLFKVG